MAFSTIIKCITGPRLYRIHNIEGKSGYDYKALTTEAIGDHVLKWAKFIAVVIKWTSPLLLVILYRRGVFTNDGLISCLSYTLSALPVFLAVLILRAAGRYWNDDYRAFSLALVSAQQNHSPQTMNKLRRYDFEFNAWPPDYVCCVSNETFSAHQRALAEAEKKRSIVERLRDIPINVLSFGAIHTFGIRMVYPGATSIIQMLMAPALTKGRASWIEERSGLRAKLVTADGVSIDTMFVDRRRDSNASNGKILAICSEGNAGFYEVGCALTPFEAGYSVLGWNHPGFWGSTGQPYPSQEQNGITAVVEYAVSTLGFRLSDVILFSWSIGGYCSTFAAMTYPAIKHLILDATFDDMLPLAKSKMPVSWGTLVDRTLHKYMYLNIAEQLCRYPGPVLLIRRTRDEMITTVDPSVIASNRGNDLLLQLLTHRYPGVVNSDTIPQLRDYLAIPSDEQEKLRTSLGVSEARCLYVIDNYLRDNVPIFPLDALGASLDHEEKVQLAIFLCWKHVLDFASSHCTPLPASFVQTPWQPFQSVNNTATNNSSRY